MGSRFLAFLLTGFLLVLNSARVNGFDSGLKLSTYRSGRRRKWTNLTISVHQFGAVGDGCTDDTESFTQAWKHACSSRAIAVIVMHADYRYLIRQVQFGGPCKSKITFLVLGTIIAPSDPDMWYGLDSHKWLYFHGVKDFTVTGGGTINGMGHEWWARSCKHNATNPCRHAPTAVTFHRIKRLTVNDLTLINSQQMHVAFTRSFQVHASNLKVIAPEQSPNTDGIHISECNFVRLEDSIIRTGDDCVSIVGNSSSVSVKNIICGPGHGISIGSLGKSNSSVYVENVEVDGAFISNTENGVRIKTWQGGSGFARNIIFKNILMNNVSNPPIIIDQYYCDSKRPCKNQTSAVEVYDISYVSIRGTSGTEKAIKFACSDTHACENIYLEDVVLSLKSEMESAAFCWNAFGSSSGVLYPPSCLSCSDYFIRPSVNADTLVRSSSR